MTKPIAIVDLFSGPGGLGEGFCASRCEGGERRYEINISIEKETSAHETLLLRAFLRKFKDGMPKQYYDFMNGLVEEPDWPTIYPNEWRDAEHEAKRLELGQPETAAVLEQRIAEIRAEHGGRTVLIGGPPCQAYSLVGRSRNSGKKGYDPETDHRNFLYEQYVKVLGALKPAVFVMENVKGMLSSAVKGSRIFQQVMEDLQAAGGPNSYRLIALAPSSATLDVYQNPLPSDFIVRAEDFGIPQARHRVLIVGIRVDVVESIPEALLPRLERSEKVSVEDVIGGLLPMRSGLSRDDDALRWKLTVLEACDLVENNKPDISKSVSNGFREAIASVRSSLLSKSTMGRSTKTSPKVFENCPSQLKNWLIDEHLTMLQNHVTRGHMASDLARYLFASIYGKVIGVSPVATQFPKVLAPAHKNWESGKFEDRFRVQVGGRPSSTITSHISKDGHYFIHPDPVQCRSLTVREAARLQTFPDNYLFKGNHTEQYVQVGNAVPPYLALQIANSVWNVFEYLDQRSETDCNSRKSRVSEVV